MLSREIAKKIHPALELIYQRLEHELEALTIRCKACGRCCDFGNFDFTPYASSIEVDYLLSNVNKTTKESPENSCPFLKEGKCSIRPFRTLGCRTFFCTTPDKDAMQKIHDNYLREIKALADKYGLQWNYRPLLQLLFYSNET